MDTNLCVKEFGPHSDHSDCERIMADMAAPFGEYRTYNPTTGQWDYIY